MITPRRRDPNAGMWRFLEDLRARFDRRAGTDRRGYERGGTAQSVASNHRVSDRRSMDRRMTAERRGTTREPFTDEEVARIHQMLTDSRTRVICPRCGGNLLLTLPVTRSRMTIQSVLCTGCPGRMEM
ncbi:MAG: hypothetical protein IH965_11680 [Gemmatimonadetes bacterium]|nr:hypothetical protein [Gemmatimonadota bacterium]